MIASQPSFQHFRLPSDPIGAGIGVFFWGAITLFCWGTIIGALSAHSMPWLDYQDASLDYIPLLNPESMLQINRLSYSYPNWLPPLGWTEMGIWLTGRAFPLIMLLISGVALRRALHFFRHRHNQSASSWIIRFTLALILTSFSFSGFSVWNDLPLAQSINPSLQLTSGGFLGSEYVAILRYFINDIATLVVLVAGIITGVFWMYGIGLFRLCEMIGLILEYIQTVILQKKSERHDRSLGQIMTQMREQTLKLSTADKSVTIIRTNATQHIFMPPSQPQNLFAAQRAPTIANPAITHKTHSPNLSPFDKSSFYPSTPSPSIKTFIKTNQSSTPNPFSTEQSTVMRHRKPTKSNTASFKIISKPDPSQRAVASSTSSISVKNASFIPRDPHSSSLGSMPSSVKLSDSSKLIQKTNNDAPLPSQKISVENNLPANESLIIETANQSLASALPLPDEAYKMSETAIIDNEAIKPELPSKTYINKNLTAINDSSLTSLNKLNNTNQKSPDTPEKANNQTGNAAPDEGETPGNEDKENKTSGYSNWSDFPLPSLNLLDTTPAAGEPPNDEVIRVVSGQIESALKSFGVSVEVKAAYPGPVITRYEIQLASGVKGAQIVNLSKDLARTLAVMSIRVVENIPGKPWMGLEVPNERRQMVKLAEIISSPDFQNEDSPLTMAIGKDISGMPRSLNLSKMPHLLVAGTTGSGKSVGLNGMILSMLYKATPNEVRMVMIDPKMVELSVYSDIPHLIAPVITDMKQAVGALNWCIKEMERREQLLSKLSVRNIAKFNQKVVTAREKGAPIYDPVEKERLEEMGAEDFSSVPILMPLPYLVVIVDEFADLFMVIGKKIEEVIARLAQKGRAGGIHLILATQRPSVDVVTGLIKANVPSRIAFQVSSKIDSRTILDQQGAETLLGQGDMLYYRPGEVVQRMHGAFVSDDEVNDVAEYLRSVAPPKYLVHTFDDPTEESRGKVGTGLTSGKNGQDDYDIAVQIIVESPAPSISFLQRRMEIGFNKAAKFIEQMEKDGIISAPQKNGKRNLLSPRVQD